MIAHSGGIITKTVLRNNNPKVFLEDVCSALLASGWTEVSPSYPWQSLYIQNNVADGGWLEPFPGIRYTWRTTPTQPRDVLRTGNNPTQDMINMFSKLQADGHITKWILFGKQTTPTVNFESNYSGSFYDLSVSGEGGSTDYRFRMKMTITYSKMYRSGVGYLSGNEYAEPWMWGFRRFDSPTTPDGLKIRLWVGWQTTAAYSSGVSSCVVYPCFRITSVDDVVDPNPSYLVNSATAPKWHPCVDITDKNLVWDMICGPYWFYIAARGETGARKWIYGGTLKLLGGYKPYSVSIVPGKYTQVNFSEPHKMAPNQFISFARVLGTNNINGIPLQVYDVLTDTSLRLNFDTTGNTYSTGICGSTLNPVNVGFVISPENTNQGPPRSSMGQSASGTIAGSYMYNINSWTSGTTGTSSTASTSYSYSIWPQHMRLAGKKKTRWYGKSYSIYEPLVGWTEFFSSRSNYIYGMLWDSFVSDVSFPLDMELTIDGMNWKQIMNPNAGYSFWIRIP